MRDKSVASRESDVEVPETVALEGNYPNPFNPTTNIRYNLTEPAHVKLTVYNTLGQKVKTLVNGFQSAGAQTVTWNATNQAGQPVSAGIYLYKLEAAGQVKIMKMALTK